MNQRQEHAASTPPARRQHAASTPPARRQHAASTPPARRQHARSTPGARQEHATSTQLHDMPQIFATRASENERWLSPSTPRSATRTHISCATFVREASTCTHWRLAKEQGGQSSISSSVPNKPQHVHSHLVPEHTCELYEVRRSQHFAGLLLAHLGRFRGQLAKVTQSPPRFAATRARDRLHKASRQGQHKKIEKKTSAVSGSSPYTFERSGRWSKPRSRSKKREHAACSKPMPDRKDSDDYGSL